jgi:predicted acylesterase/phospholipase RssA
MLSRASRRERRGQSIAAQATLERNYPAPPLTRACSTVRIAVASATIQGPLLISAEPQVPDRDELRLALALNGGVSLAVWMGGAVQELDDVRCADEVATGEDVKASRHVYEQILAALKLRVRVDIAAATSAGGMNGPLLAVAAAEGNRVTNLRELWMTVADFGSLLRKTGDPEPPSLLDGDGYVLSNVTKRLEDQFAAPPSRAPQRFRLILTGTDIQGTLIEPIKDSYDAELPRVEHRLQFRFATPDAPGGAGGVTPGWLPLASDRTAEIARAARTSSAFPFAFEPSRISGDDFTSGVWTRLGGPLEIGAGKHRWAMDGGVLDNSPIQPVLNEIWDTPTADGPQRRCIVFVTPYATEAVSDPPEQATLTSVLGATFNMPRDVPHVDDLARLADDVRQRDQTRESDAALLALGDAALGELARAVATPFDRYRVWRALQASAGRLGISLVDDRLEGWASLPEVRAAVWYRVAPDALGSSELAGVASWRWGGEHVRNAATRWRVRLTAARRALPAGSVSQRNALRQIEAEIQHAIQRARAAEDEEIPAPPATTAAAPGSDLERLEADLEARYLLFANTPGSARIHACWREAILCVERSVARARLELGDAASAAALDAMLADAPVTAQRMLQVEAILQSLGSPLSADSRPSVEVEFLRLSTSPLLDGSPSSYAYLYGAQLGHFGGFIRTSWRAHDWLVGRLDGAAAVVNLLFNSRRIAESGLTNDAIDELYARVRSIPDQGGTVVLPPCASLPAGAALPSTDDLVQWKTAFKEVLQVLILHDELGQIREAVGVERSERWSPTTPQPSGKCSELKDVKDAFDAYLKRMRDAGGAKQIVTGELGSSKGSRLVADASVVTANVLSSHSTGFPAFVGATTGSARGAIRTASFAVHRATGNILERTLFVVATGAAGAALAWAVARGAGSDAATGAGGGSPFKETVAAASLTILTVAIVLALRPFASRILSLAYGVGTAVALMLMVGWIWTGQVQATCAPATPCGAVGATTYVYLVAGIVALSTSIGWIATATLRTAGQWVASLATVAFAVLLAFGLADPSGRTHSIAHRVRHLPVAHALSKNSGWSLLVLLLALACGTSLLSRAPRRRRS